MNANARIRCEEKKKKEKKMLRSEHLEALRRKQICISKYPRVYRKLKTGEDNNYRLIQLCFETHNNVLHFLSSNSSR